MKFLLQLESDDGRYEVVFDIDNPDTAEERLATTLADVEKRFIKKRGRDSATPRAKTPKDRPGGASSPGGAA